jgi:glycosyltransferase involved in cell wall biosynthesis
MITGPAAARCTLPGVRVLIVEQGGRGGVADYTGALVRALAAQGCAVELATARDHRYADVAGVRARPVFRYVRGRGPLGRLIRRAGLGRLANGLLFLAAVPRLARLARRTRLVHTEGWELLPLGVLAVAAMRLAGATVVQTEHNTFVRGGSRERSRRALAALTARTVVHSRADLARTYGAAVVIPHGEYRTLAGTGGAADRTAARERLGIPPDAPAVILFGQLRPDKGLGDLLAALPRVPEVHAIVAGEDRGGLAPVAGQLAAPELAGRVHVRAAFVEMSEAAELFAAADAAVLPYRQASQSGVLLLAYGFARPVVAYPVGGLAEAIVDGETGWLCARPDPEALADALAAVAAAGAEECRRRGAAGRRHADAEYGWDAIAARTLALYREVS